MVILITGGCKAVNKSHLVLVLVLAIYALICSHVLRTGETSAPHLLDREECWVHSCLELGSIGAKLSAEMTAVRRLDVRVGVGGDGGLLGVLRHGLDVARGRIVLTLDLIAGLPRACSRLDCNKVSYKA